MDPEAPVNPQEESIDNSSSTGDGVSSDNQSYNIENTVVTESDAANNLVETSTDPEAEASESAVPDTASEDTTNVPLDETNLDPEPATSAYNPFAYSDNVAPAPQSDVAPAPLAPLTSKKTGKRWLKPVIVVLAILILVGGGAGAYAFWFQSPQHVVSDTMTNLLSGDVPTSADITLSSDSELAPGTPVNIKLKNLAIDAKTSKDANAAANASLTIALNGRDYTVDAKVIATRSGDAYFQINNVKELIQKFLKDFAGDSSSIDLSSAFTSSLDKLQNKWVKISADTSENANNNPMQCMMDTLNKHLAMGGSNVLSEAYQKHPFIEAEHQVASRDGNLGFEVTIDQDKAKQFNSELKDSDLAKELQKCNTGDSASSSSANENLKDDVDGTATIYVSRFAHRLMALDYSFTTSLTKANANKATFKGNVDFGYGADNKITVPSESEPFDTWKNDLTELVMQYMMSTLSPADSTSFSTTDGIM